ncbi:phage tail protein [Sphingomonas sp. BIUV-7]|uniref:Phage tail protein n=2 Tax=Sphingomonas natans TaxID=3063330 RepID=A0ABT8Y6Z6_9SPHN|nr:phage tail protein [Sphingomonas sp. BIUV-7]MDO6413787.1 phage tail protein [Sphingomonas sp. BIUV-7]
MPSRSSLTFEVEADAGDVDVGTIVAALSEGAVVGETGTAVGGYAAGGDSVRGAIEALGDAFPLAIVDDGATLRLDDASASMIDPEELGARVDDRRESRIVRDRRAASTLPDEVAIAYYEPERDYQAGLQRARRDGIALRSNRIELPVAIGAGAAKGFAEAALMRVWRGRERATVRLPWRRLDLRAGGRVTLDGAAWRIASWTLERMALELDLERIGPGAVAASASPGRATTGADARAGTTVIELLDIPAFDGSGGGDAPRLWLAAAGTGTRCRRATASLSLDGGASWRTFATTAPPAVMGTLTRAPAPGPSELFDRANSIEVELLHDNMTVPGGGDAALIDGRNLALIGDELIAFAGAEQIAPRRWRLGGLLRGRFGSEWAMAGHETDERFVLIEAGRLLPIDLPATALGGPIAVSAIGPGDAGPPATRAAIVIGRGVRPPSPVALRARRLAGGAIRIDWIRRSRRGWAWLDGADVPLGEESELYRLTLASGGTERTIDVTSPSFDYAADDQPPELRDGPGALTVTISQIGRLGASLPPAAHTFTL